MNRLEGRHGWHICGLGARKFGISWAMRPRLPLALALFAALAAPAPVLAGGGEASPTSPLLQLDRELFQVDTVFQSYSGERMPFNVVVDLSRNRVRPTGPVWITAVAVTPDRWTLNLVSRPLRAGEKVGWTGTLPREGVLVVNVVWEGGTFSLRDTGDRLDSGLSLTITGDERGVLRLR